MSRSQDMSLANVADSVTDEHSQEVLKKFAWAIKRVTNEENSGEDDKATTLTQDELIHLIKAWEPQRDIICLYVRWARQLRRNFNLDSIATLLCLSRQCDYAPVDFLRRVKTLSIHKNMKAAYGITFHFDIPNRKDLNRERLNKEFLGLSVTLALLQEQITDSPSILGKTRMRQSGPRTTYPLDIPIGTTNKECAKVITHPNMEFHTQSSLLNRIWISISHRWIALHVTEHLFREFNGPWSYLDALVYSFQMMAPCGPGRFEFLSSLVGYCLRFRNQDAIESKRSRLREIWKEPSSFMSYGNTCLTQFAQDAQSRIIITCFQDLQSEIPLKSKQISYHRDCTWTRRWIMLRAYIFHFWLDSSANSRLKAIVTSEASSNLRKSKRKIDAFIELEASANDSSLLTGPTIPEQVQYKTSKLTDKKQNSGLHSITSSRRIAKNQTSTATSGEGSTAVNVGGKIGNVANNPDLSTTSTLKDTEWESLRLITAEEMLRFVQSYLLIHRLDGVDILSELSPLEVYSANHLHDLEHCRLSGKAPFIPTGKVGPIVLHIGTDADCFIDRHAKALHVAREQSEYFNEYSHNLPTMHQIQLLCKAIISFGYIDSKRAVGQYRVNIGNGGQNWVNGAPCQLHGIQFQKHIEKDGTYDVDAVLQSIGQLAEFTWRVMCGLQNDASDHPIAPDSFRRQVYASRLNQYLNMDHEIGFEDLTLVVSSLYPTTHEVASHKDLMNDTVAGYTRTAAFNMVMIDDDDRTPTIIHFQLICNFRKVIGHYLLPFHKYLLPVAKHAREYLDRWHRSIQSVYAGRTVNVPTVYDRSTFFLDDTLDYSTIAISEEGKHKQSIASEYILTEINISRTLSLSMFIDPLVKLQRFLKFDQTIELALVSSFLSNPFWFDWSMSTILKRLDDPDDSYQLGLHPFYDWSHVTFEIFGTWQGGPYNRWSPCGGNKESVIQTFGAQPNATHEERKHGEMKLSQVIAILWEHVQWINSLSTCGNMPVVDMPISTLKAKCERTIKEIANVAPCQFSHFRLGILTTILSGCGLLKEGKHLRNLMYPVKGSASYKHLCSPVADYMSLQRARALGNNETNEDISNDGTGVVEESQHDLFMQYLSAELGFRVYVRDEMECILCESHPMRSLNCRDWFRKGISLYDCNENGEFFRRDYGRTTEWVKLLPPDHYHLAYLETSPIKYIPLDAKLSYYAAEFGKKLRSSKVVFKGRDSRTSSHQRSYSNSYNSKETYFCHLSMQMADFYLQSQVKKDKIHSMFVLGDAEHAVETSCCNRVEDYPIGKILHSYLQTLLPISSGRMSSAMAAACYHRDSELNNNEVTFFPGHLDKPFVHTAWFVPLGMTPFFTIISVSRFSNVLQDPDSMRLFNEWKATLSISDSQKLDCFLENFNIQARKHMRQESLLRLVYLSKCGSVLSFPANQCYHATITPKKVHGFPRDLFIFHPLDGIARRD